MRILCLQHDPLDGPGALLDWAKERRHSLSLFLIGNDTPLPGIDTFDLLVSLGGPMGAYEEEKHPWLATEKEFLRLARAEGRKILGLCLGCQLLADAFGGKAFRHTRKEFGWQPIEPTRAGAEWFGTDGIFHAFQWHGDTYTMPPDGIRLAGNKAAEEQAFLIETQGGSTILGLQFHLEWTEAMAREALAEPGVAPPASEFVQSPEEILRDPTLFTLARNRFFGLLDRFVSR
jgi:GMP synthase-like glutamine amidotransferase